MTIDPVGTAPIFAGLTASLSPVERQRTAVRGVMIAAVILLGFALGGEPLLGLLGIGLPAFRIAGGVLLLLLAVDMVMVRHSGLRTTTGAEAEESEERADISVFPLAIPLIAGPGALTSIVLLMSESRDHLSRLNVVGELLLVLLLTLLLLLGAGRLTKVLGITGVNVVTRVFGILLAALAVQFVTDGVLALVRS